MILAPKTDQYFMQEALKEARKAFDLDEVVGAIIVCEDQIVLRHNFTEHLK